MRAVVVAVLSMLVAGCAVVTAPYDALEKRLQRDDDVYQKHGVDLDEVRIGYSRDTVYEVWGEPRRTTPRYRDIDIYLAVRNDSGAWRVLPGDYNDLKRTTPLVVQLSYVDEHVNAIHLFDQTAYGNSRRWCDDVRLCAELFPFHSGDGDPANPLIVTSRGSGFDDRPVSEGRCEVVVFVSAADPDWSNRVNFLELRKDGQPMGYIVPDSYHVSSYEPGPLTLSVWPNVDYRGVIGYRSKSDWANDIALDCTERSRLFVQAGPQDRGFWMLDPGVELVMLDADRARDLLSDKRPILPSTAATAAPAIPVRTARLSRQGSRAGRPRRRLHR